MILTAHQPVYIPWLGLFHKIALADKFCVFDIAQYQTKDYNNRNKIKTPNGVIWLSVPVESKDHFSKTVGEIKIHHNGWHKKHFKSISLAYRKAPFYKQYIDQVEEILINRFFKYLAELNFAFLEFGMKCLDISLPIVYASDYEFRGQKSDLVLDMVKQLSADVYIFGEQGRNYARVDDYTNAGKKIYFQNYKHPQYSQLHGEFVENMSFLDLVFNVGPDSKEILMQGNVPQDELPELLDIKG